MNAIQPIEPTAPAFPIVYATQLNLNGSQVDGYDDGDLVLINSIEEPQAGDLVCVHTKRSGAVMIVLNAGFLPHAWERMPWVPSPRDEVEPMIVGTLFGADRQLAFRASAIWAVHKCDGKADPADCATGAA